MDTRIRSRGFLFYIAISSTDTGMPSDEKLKFDELSNRC